MCATPERTIARIGRIKNIHQSLWVSKSFAAENVGTSEITVENKHDASLQMANNGVNYGFNDWFERRGEKEERLD